MKTGFIKTLFISTCLLILSACSIQPKYSDSRNSSHTQSHYSVNGKKYYVLASAENYHEVGIASWYGKQFHGKLTSNGEIYDMYQMTAAHKTLPLPTHVKVTNLGNNKSIIVKVNDRGPFKSNRIIDLSYAAAVELDFHKQGTTKVSVTTINPTLNNQATNTQNANAITFSHIKELVYVQVGAFSQVENVQPLLKKLLQSGYATTIIPTTENNKDIYRLRIGPFTSTQHAEKTLYQLTTIGFNNGLIIVEPNNLL